MGKIGAGFKIVAVIDGATLNGYLRVEGPALVQRYEKGSTVCTPDFGAMAENERPVIIPIVKDSMGNWKNATKIVWNYNRQDLAFDEHTGLCTTQGLEGMFKVIKAYEFDYTPTERKTTTVLRVMKNFYSVNNTDNDRIGCKCSVEVNGDMVQVEEMFRDVIIEETTGESWTIDLNNADITEAVPQVEMKPIVRKMGKELKDLAGLTFKWFKQSEKGWEPLGTRSTQVITKNDVHGSLQVKCELHVDNSVISATATVEDYSDARYVDFIKEGMVGESLYPGKTAVVTPVARFRSDGTVDARYNQWEFYLKDNAGNAFGGKEVFTNSKATVTYDEVKKAGGGVSGYVKSLIDE